MIENLHQRRWIGLVVPSALFVLVRLAAEVFESFGIKRVTFENAFLYCWLSLAVLIVLSAYVRLAKMHF